MTSDPCPICGAVLRSATDADLQMLMHRGEAAGQELVRRYREREDHDALESIGVHVKKND